VADIWEPLDALRQRRSVKWQEYGPDVLPLWVAEMDVALAPPVHQAVASAVARSDTGYMHPGGLAEAFAGFAARRYGWPVDAADVLVVADVMLGVAEALRVLTRPGDPVVINTPVYPPFFACLADLGRRTVPSPLRSGPDGPTLDLEHLEDCFAAGARAYLLCSPHNPTGSVFVADELRAVGMLAERYGVRVVADEIHAPLTLRGATHVPFATTGGAAAERSVTAVSASKAWNLAGLKCALLVAGASAREDLARIPAEVGKGAGLLGVVASEAAFRDGEEWLDGLREALEENRRLLSALLAEHLPQVGYVPPRATYLAWLDCRVLGLGDDPAAAFLERGKVALSPGPTFGPGGEGFARLNLATSGEVLTEAVRRMAVAVGRPGPTTAG